MNLPLVLLVGVFSSLITIRSFSAEADVEVSFLWSNCDNDICDVTAQVYAPSTFFTTIEISGSYRRVGWDSNQCRKTADKFSFLVRFEICSKSLTGMSKLPVDQFNPNEDLLEPALFFQYGDSWRQRQTNHLVLDCSLYSFRRIASYRELVDFDRGSAASTRGDLPLTDFSELINFNEINWSSATFDSEYSVGQSWGGDIVGASNYFLKYSTADGKNRRIPIGNNLDSTQLRRRENALDYIQSQCTGVTSRF